MVEQKREYFRVEFPQSYRPSLEMDVDHYEIADVSEFGIRFNAGGDNSFTINDLIIGTIVFPDGKDFELSGQVTRIDDGYVSLELAEPLPLSKIRAEHLYLIGNY